MLEVNDLHAYYGKSHILQGVSFSIQEGEIVSLLGRNGVGRSTTVKTIMGEVEPHGSIRYKNQEIAGKKAFEIAQLGIGYVPENRDIFPTLWARNPPAPEVAGRSRKSSTCSQISLNAQTYMAACSAEVNNRCFACAAH